MRLIENIKSKNPEFKTHLIYLILFLLFFISLFILKYFNIYVIHSMFFNIILIIMGIITVLLLTVVMFLNYDWFLSVSILMEDRSEKKKQLSKLELTDETYQHLLKEIEYLDDEIEELFWGKGHYINVEQPIDDPHYRLISQAYLSDLKKNYFVFKLKEEREDTD